MRRTVLFLSCAALVGCPSPNPQDPEDDTTTGAVDPPTTKPDGVIGGGDPTSDPSPDPELTTTGNGPTTISTTGGELGTTTTDATPSPVDTATGDDGATSSSVPDGDTIGDDTTGDAWQPKGCPGIYAQNILPTFELDIAPDVFEDLEDEWEEGDDEDLDKHPLKAFTYEEIEINNASIRLRGNASHWPDQGKMQFEVEFNTFDKKGRFMGLRQVLFDAAAYNKSFLRDRLALSILRDAGVPAPCANNARLVVNGEYYGLFTSIEKVDKEFLERHFEDSDGNLYKRGGGDDWTKKTNDEDDDTDDIEKLEDAKNLSELLKVLNLEQAILEWAGEAVIPNRDGLWAGGLNGYTYNDPKTGLFHMIPWDLDDSFTRLEPDVDPITFKKEKEVFHGRPYYDIALKDPAWKQKYVDALEHVLTTAYQVEVLQQRIDEWSAQIAEAVAEDPNKPFTMKEHLEKVKEKREFVEDRAEFLEEWLADWKDDD
jgi:spore coat protein CotH